MLLNAAVDAFILDRQTHCSPDTVRYYRYFLARLVGFLGDRDLQDLNASDLNAFLVSERTRARRDQRGGSISASTVAGAVRSLRCLFAWSHDQELTEANIAARLKGPRATPAVKSLTLDQARIVVNATREGKWKDAVRDHALVLFLLDSGCRAGEVMGLACDHLNLAEGFADVLGKGSKARRIGISPATVEAIRTYLGSRQTGFLFQSEKQNHLCREALREILRRLSRRVGVKLHPHLFRHTFGTLMVADGADVSHVQTLMGHSDIATTYGYCQAARAKAALKDHERHSPIHSLA